MNPYLRSGAPARLVLALLFVMMLPTVRASAQTLPAGWASSDVGAVGAEGAASSSGGTFTVTGAGSDIWGTADAFRFAYTTLTGDGSIVARVASVEAVNAWTKAGVMMRASLAAGSAQATMLVSPGKGLAFQRRVTANGVSTNTAGPMSTAPYFVKLMRAGGTITALASSNGSTWVTVGTQSITLPSTIYVGLAVGSHVAGRLATAVFDSVGMTGNTTPPPATTATLVFFRHGEKPAGGYGQITCQGLQRALALPPVLIGRYGGAQHIFAPNPRPQVTDQAGSFDYVRPLATIEPTAIRLGLPVNAQYGFTDLAGVQSALLTLASANGTIFIAWEHLKLRELVQNIMNAYDSGVIVPSWPSGDYDSLYVVRLTTAGGTTTAVFEHEFQGLNGLPTACP